MANAGTITGNLVLRPDDYLQNLNRAADATQKFSRQVSGISFQGFNRGIIATTTLLYGMNRIMSSMSKGMEDFSNVLARIGAVADLTAGSVQQLSESMKSLSTSYGVGRTDIMKGMYSIAQSRFTDPREMLSMAGAAAHLSLASGKEINVHKSADLLSVARQALGIGVDAISSRRTTDILLKGRDVGRWELDQMAAALGIPMTIYGNQFSGKLGGEETLRQLIAIMSTATLAGINPNRAATGTRRLVERTVQLSKGGSVSKEFSQALRGIGFTGENPILDALNQGPMAFLNTLTRLTGGKTEALNRFGFGSRDLMLLTAAVRSNAGTLNKTYQELSYGGIAGTTERYAERMRGTYGYTRDKLRAEWEITSQEFMQSSIPLIGSLTDALTMFNKIAQALPSSVKSMMMLVAGLSSLRFALNLFGFKGSIFGISSQRMTGGGDKWVKHASGFAAMGGVGLTGKERRLLSQRSDAFENVFHRNIMKGLPIAHTADISSTQRSASDIALAKRYGITPGFGGNWMYRGARGFAGGAPTVGGAISKQMALGQYAPIGDMGYGTGYGGRSVPQHLLPTKMASFSARSVGQYVGISGALSERGLRLSGPAYKDMGFGSLIQVTGGAISAISSFSKAITGLLTPMALMTVAVSTITNIVRGATREPRLFSSHSMVGGETLLSGRSGSSGKRVANIFDVLRVGQELTGSFLSPYGKEIRSDILEDVARKYSLVADHGNATSFGRLDALALFGTRRLAGYRYATYQDALKEAYNKNLTPQEIKTLQDRGINIRGWEDVLKHIGPQLKGEYRLPQHERQFNAFLRGPEGLDKGVEVFTTALRKLSSTTEEAAAAVERVAARIEEVVRSATMDWALRNKSLDARQFSIYGSTSTGFDTVDWGAGGGKYLDMYRTGLRSAYGEFGGLADTQRSMNLHRKYAEMSYDENYGKALSHTYKERKPFGDKMRRLSQFLEILPYLKTMKRDDLEKHFSEITGRTRGTDDYFDTNLRNFANMDVSGFLDVIGRDRTRYESAVSLGTTEAYNLMLPREDPSEKMLFHFEKISDTLEKYVIQDEVLEKEKDHLIKNMETFFNNPNLTNFIDSGTEYFMVETDM